MRLINADDIPYAVNVDHPSGEYDYAYRCEIDAMPTVDAVPVVHGRWEKGQYKTIDITGETYYDGEAVICTNCRCGFKKEVVDWRWNYCPACGADMRGEQDG